MNSVRLFRSSGLSHLGRRDEGAASAFADEQAFINKVTQRLPHRDAAQAERVLHLLFGGDEVIRLPLTRLDLFEQMLFKLVMEG
jgi:hypothetical protein